jgi:DNA-binding Lrp family transcriptional regulator
VLKKWKAWDYYRLPFAGQASDPGSERLRICRKCNWTSQPISHGYRSLKNISEVVECHFVTGKYALLLKLYCRDHDHLMEVLIDIIRNIPSVIQTETLISLDQAIERQVWVKQ